MADDTQDETQQILGEIRRVRRAQEEIVGMLLVDTPWIRARDHLLYGLRTLQEIPLLARTSLFLGILALGASVLYKNLRLFFIGVDLLFVSLLFVGGQ